MKSIDKAALLLSTVAASAIVWSPVARGQESAATEPAEPALEEIVVTAQRRVENLQTVPIAATSLSGNKLENAKVERVSDLQFASPSLSVTSAGETESVNIRGIGLSSNLPSVTNGVASYVDGLFQAQIVTAVPFYDIANVEILRGPQGTLVGNNSTGGAIFINSKSPALGRVEGYAQVGVGSYERREAEGALNVPLGDTLALRVAGVLHTQNSFYEDVGPFANDAGKIDERGLRVGLLWDPGSFQALLKLQWHQSESGGFAYRPVAGTAFAPFAVGGPRTLSYDADTSQRDTAFQAALELKYETAGGVTLRSLSGYQVKRNQYVQDTDATQLPLSPTGGFVVDYFARDRQFSEEINIISPTNGRFDWILGAYYQHTDILVDYLTISPPPRVDIRPRQKRDVLGVFGQGNYQLTPTLQAQLGLRYSRVDTSGTGDVVVGAGELGFPPGGIPVASVGGEHQDARVTGKFALNWKANERHFFYAFVARGYKPGGFNSPVSQFDPETVWDYEIGWKATWAGGRLRTQLGAFYNDYRGLQFDIVEPSTGVAAVRNIGSARIKGIEAQVQGQFGGLGFDLGAAYVDSDVDPLTFINARALPPGQLGPQCPIGVPSTPPFCFDYGPFTIANGGGPNLYSPKWTFNAGIEYRIPIGGATLTPRINYGYVGDRFNYLAYGPGDRLAARGLLSASLTLAVGPWRIEAYGTNLTDHAYVSGRSGDNEFYGAPREYGVRAGVRF